MNIFELSINMFECLSMILFFSLYFGFKHNGWKRYAELAGGVLVHFFSLTYLNMFKFYTGMLEISITLSIFILYNLLFLKGDPVYKVFIAVFMDSLMMIIAAMFTIIGGVVFGLDVITNTLEFQFGRIVLVLVVQVVRTALFIFLLRFKIDRITRNGQLIPITILSVLMSFSVSNMLTIYLQHSDMGRRLAFIANSVFGVAILIYYIFVKININAERESELATIRQKYENDRRYAEEVIDFYDKTRSMRHDMKNHLLTALALMQSEKAEEAQRYMETLIEKQTGVMPGYIQTDNDAFNAIANVKLADCEKFGIKPTLRVMDGSFDRLTFDEIGVLFGNLFDNAIEASKDSKEKRIDLDVQLFGEQLSIFMKNSIDCSVLAANKKLLTTKADKEYHGFGIRNIRKIVEDRSGVINFFEEEGYFCCDILM